MSRNTPTCVGKTVAQHHHQNWIQKHPHVRGEDAWACCIAQAGTETPPRAWGRRVVHGGVTPYLGNTPTCVGKTEFGDSCVLSVEKHPHVRGEDGLRVAIEAEETETPPRAWGRQSTPRLRQNGRRNTPTCVGKTSAHGFRLSLEEKHPHVRGEDNARQSAGVHPAETPPRAWGRPRQVVHRSFQNTTRSVLARFQGFDDQLQS